MKLVALLVIYVFVNPQHKPQLAQMEIAMPLGSTAHDCEEIAVPAALNKLFAARQILAFDHQCITFDLEPLQSANAK